MKKSVQKSFCLLLALLVMLAALPLGAAASETAGEVYFGGDGQRGYLARHTSASDYDEAGYTAAQWFSAPAGATADGSFYSQLTTRQKSCYNALENIPISQIINAAESDGFREVQVNIPEIWGITLTGSVDASGQFVPDSASNATYRSIYTDLVAAIIALRYDRPEMMWLDEMLYGFYWVTSDNRTAKIEEVLFAFNLHLDGLEYAMNVVETSAAQQLANAALAQPTLYDQVMYVHDALAEGSSYNFGHASSEDPYEEFLSHQSFSALVTDDYYHPVCDGYSKALKVVLNLMDIPCVLVISETHMWANVKMDDEEWYIVDLTWDDLDGAPCYDYFLIGTQTVVDGEPFNRQEEHQEKSIWIADSKLNNVTFRYPTKNSQAYEPVPGGYEPLRFPDVKRSAWYYDHVERAASMGLFSGDDNGKFNPDKNISRAEFVQVLYNAQGGGQQAGSVSFSDIKRGDWYYNAVAWASKLGIVSGSDGKFRPNSPITREEMCVILNNYSKKVGLDAPGSSGHTFTDDSKISSWARQAVYNAYAMGLVSGNPDGSFAPGSNTIRCQAATVFVKYVQALENAGLA